MATTGKSEYAGLTCSRCTFINEPKWKTCNMCGAAVLPEQVIAQLAKDIESVALEMQAIVTTGAPPGTASSTYSAVELAQRAIVKANALLTKAAIDLDAVEVDATARERRRTQLKRLDRLEAFAGKIGAALGSLPPTATTADIARACSDVYK